MWTWLEGIEFCWMFSVLHLNCSLIINLILSISCRKGKFNTKITQHSCKRQAGESWPRMAFTVDRTCVNLLYKEIVTQNIGNCSYHKGVHIFQCNGHPTTFCNHYKIEEMMRIIYFYNFNNVALFLCVSDVFFSLFYNQWEIENFWLCETLLKHMYWSFTLRLY